LFLSRSELDLQRRVDILVKALEKEDFEKIPKKSSFEDIAEQMRQGMIELRILDAKLIEEAKIAKRIAA